MALEEAEGQLSEYRAALHKRIAEATTELIARYREEPTLCLIALPQAPEQRSPAASDAVFRRRRRLRRLPV